MSSCVDQGSLGIIYIEEVGKGIIYKQHHHLCVEVYLDVAHDREK